MKLSDFTLDGETSVSTDQSSSYQIGYLFQRTDSER